MRTDAARAAEEGSPAARSRSGSPARAGAGGGGDDAPGGSEGPPRILVEVCRAVSLVSATT